MFSCFETFIGKYLKHQQLRKFHVLSFFFGSPSNKVSKKMENICLISLTITVFINKKSNVSLKFNLLLVNQLQHQFFRETKADLAGILNLIQEIAHLFIFIADILQLYSALFN